MQDKLDKAIEIKQDPCLPKPQRLTVSKCLSIDNIGKRVELYGWCKSIEKYQRSKHKIMIVKLRDGTGFPTHIRCILQDDLVKLPTYTCVLKCF